MRKYVYVLKIKFSKIWSLQETVQDQFFPNNFGLAQQIFKNKVPLEPYVKNTLLLHISYKYECHDPGYQCFVVEIFELINFQDQVTAWKCYFRLSLYKKNYETYNNERKKQVFASSKF